MKKIITLIAVVLMNSIMGITLGASVGIDPLVSAISANGLAVVAGLFTPIDGIREGVLVEIWTGELVKKLRAGLDGSWLDGIPDASSVAEKDVIHLIDVGADPDVLINNTTYPIAVQELEDGDISISLDKFQTKATPITDDELYAISYDKMARVKESHASSIDEGKFRKAAHSIASSVNKVATTGEADPNTGRRKLTKADLLAVKAKMDSLNIPTVGRRLVLTGDHVIDILGWSETFAKQYNLDNVNGKVGRLYGFDIYEYGDCPVFNSAGTKQALGTAESTGLFKASFAFYDKRVFKATGSTKMYFSEAKNDPVNQRNLINFRHYFIAMAKKTDASVTLYNGYSSSAVPTITGDTMIDNLAATAGSTVRTYATSNGAAVTATSNAAWLTAAVDANGKKVTFTRTAYAHAESGDNPRIGTVTLGIAGTDASLTVTVKQAMAES